MSKSQSLTFLGANEFLEILSAFRVCKISGRYGGGKTALAVMLASWLLASGKVNTIVSNVPTVFNSPVVTPLYNAAIILDESWQYLESRQDVLSYAAFLRKFNHFLILPTVFPIHRRLDFLDVQRVFNAYSVGFPLWVYRWALSMGKVREVGYFSVWKPTAVFGLFDTEYVPGDDGGISDALVGTSEKRGFKKRSKYAEIADLQGEAKSIETYPNGTRQEKLEYAFIQAQITEAVEELGDAAGDFDKSNAELQALSKRIRK